jgi:hypothetical protein
MGMIIMITTTITMDMTPTLHRLQGSQALHSSLVSYS